MNDRGLRIVGRAALCVAIAASSLAAASAGDRFDEDLERTVEARVDGSPELAGAFANLDVRVEARRVSLSGRVRTLAQALEAVRESGRVYGVLEVASEIAIESVGRRDAVIAAEVEDAFRDSVRTADVPVEVEVREGRVELRGTLDRAADRLLLRAAAARVPGVVAVDDLMLTEEVPDEELLARLQRVFARRGTILVAGEIDPVVDQGRVTLAGTVPRPYEAIVAEELALSVGGVRSVEVELTVVPPPAEVPVIRP